MEYEIRIIDISIMEQISKQLDKKTFSGVIRNRISISKSQMN